MVLGVDINLWAVVGAAVAAMVVGALWYSPMLFAKAWQAETGKDMSNKGDANRGYILTALGSLILAYVLAHFVQLISVSPTWVEGTQIGFWGWLGFVLPTTGSNAVFGGKSLKLFLIEQGHHLATLVVVGAIVANWV